MNVVITGATGKIGKALAPFLRSKGAKLFLQGSSKKEESEFEIFFVDLSTIEGIDQCIHSHLGSIDLFIHLASRFEQKPFEEVTEEDWDRGFDVDLKAAFFLAQKLAPHMKRGGSLIFMSDIYAKKPYAHRLPYCIAKAGVDALTKALARIFKDRLRVNALALSRIDTPEEMQEVLEKIWSLATEEKGSGHLVTL